MNTNTTINTEETINQNQNTIEYIKHFRYMTQEERLYLMSLKDRAVKKGICFAVHALDRMEERYISEKDVKRAIINGQIMEYKKTTTDEVLTIRGTTIKRNKEQIYVILSARTGKVITTYSNKYWIAYNKSAELTKYNNEIKIKIPAYFQQKYKLYY